MAKLSAQDKALLKVASDAYTKAYNSGQGEKAANKAWEQAQKDYLAAQKAPAAPAPSTSTQAAIEPAQPRTDVQDTLNQFMSNYTAALDQQYQAEQERLKQERANAQTSIMSTANIGGTLYSNLTGRDKVKYDTGTYLPGMQQAYTTYQTGLNEMRAKAAQLANTLKGYEEQNADTAYQMAQYQKSIEEQIARSQAQAYSSYLTNTAQNTLWQDALKQNPDLKSALPGLS